MSQRSTPRADGPADERSNAQTEVAIAADGPISAMTPALDSESLRMSPTAWRGTGLLCMGVGVVVALLGAARIAPAANVHAANAWQSRPVWGLFGAGIALLVAAVGLLRWHQQRAEQGADNGATVGPRILALLHALRQVARGVAAAPTDSRSSQSLPAALDVLASAEAPSDDSGYLLWLKLQLDPLVEERFPEIMAARDGFRRRHGLPAFVDVYGGLARAERLLLRSWSAAVDGYADEARTALAQALSQMEESARLSRQEDSAKLSDLPS